MVEFNSGFVVAYDDSVDEEEANDDTFSVSLISLNTVVSSSPSEITVSVVTEISSLIVVFVGIWDEDGIFSVVNGNFPPNVVNIFTFDDAIVGGFVNDGVV